MGKTVKRLYAHFQPKHYAIALTPNKGEASFEGSVTISGQRTGRPSQRLTFHQHGLKITAATITLHDKKRGDVVLDVDRIHHHRSLDEVRLHTSSLLYPGNYTVVLEFEGTITRNMDGIYPCFFEHDGTEKQLIATQFESHHAREAFPCIDEPEAKATFDLMLTTPAGETVLANTPIKTQHTKGDLVTTHFETTPHMSTYLLAFAFGKLGYKEAQTKDGITVRTYATPNNVEHTAFALDVAVKTLEFYNDYFGIPYPLEKCDMIALPDFASGAMENWGLITYREQALLVDPANTSLGMKQYVAMVVAHELAHQWFGNLVTMRWWTDLWLNEGFASWIEYLAVDHLFPEWQMWTQFIVDEQHRALGLDALEHTHPIEVAVNHPDEIRTIFDTISYSKGASVIHMLHEYLGPTVFRDGLRHYLKRHAYGNTDTVDLWQALEEVSGKPVKAFMHAWTSQPGFPLITAVIAKDTLTLQQERFFLNPAHPPAKNITWPVALQSSDSSVQGLLQTQSANYPTPPSQLKLNTGQSGFYRVAYDPKHLQRLGEHIKSGHMAPLDRLGILSDVFETAKAAKGSTANALRFLENFANEDNCAVWDVMAVGLGDIRSAMDDEPLRDAMKPYTRTLVAKQLARLGWEPQRSETHFDTLLRPTILGMASAADEPSVVAEALRRFETMKQPEDVAPDFRSIVYGTAVRKLGTTAVFDKLLAMHNASPSSEERVTIAAAITGFKDPALVQRALALVTTPTVRLQDAAYWVAYAFANRFGRDLAWEWTTSHWKWLEDNLGSDLSFSRFPMYAARSFTTPAFLKTYQDFFAPRSTPAIERAIKQGTEVLQWRAAWKQRDFDEVKAFFESK